jgi:hypothetical protein
MRVLLASAILVGGVLAASPPVDAGARYARARPPCQVHTYRAWRVAPPCRGAWPYDPNDPNGEFRGFPRWARKAFADPRN